MVEYYSAIKKEENNVICSNMGGPRDYHTKWNKSGRERQILYITYMGNVKTLKMNLFSKQNQTNRHRKQTYCYQRWKGGEYTLRT